MNCWPVEDANARFSQLLDTCIKEGPQMVTRGGTDVAVLVPIEDWKRMTSVARPTLKELLLTNENRAVLQLPKRGAGKHRRAVKL